MRWFFRRVSTQPIDELNARLDTRIQPFKLTHKQSLVDQLMYDAHVIAAAEEEAEREGTPVPVVMAKAERYAREIIPSFSPLAYFGIGTRISKWLSELIYHVNLGYVDDEELKSISPDASVIFVMNHRSNMDYVLGDLSRFHPHDTFLRGRRMGEDFRSAIHYPPPWEPILYDGPPVMSSTGVSLPAMLQWRPAKASHRLYFRKAA